MNRSALVLILMFLAVPHAAAQGTSPSAGELRALRDRLEARFDIVPLSDDIALRPKARMGDVRLIDFTDGAVHVNGAPVSGRELRDRVGAQAETILQLSYLSPSARRALATAPAAAPAEEVPAEPDVSPVDPLPPIEAPQAPEPPRAPERPRHSSGDRVRIFGNVSVAGDERVSGQVVAVLGSVRIDGEVEDQVVAVLGSVDLGPKAVVRGDVVSVGGRVNRAEGSRIRGAVTEISLANPNVRFGHHPFFGWGAGPWFDGFSALPRLIGTTFRFLLLVLLTSIAFLIARPTVEASAQRVADSPVQSTVVGIVAQILLVPALVLTTVILAISIIGIPLLLLVPFAILLLVVLALAGFSGTVYAVGNWARRRFALGSGAPFVDIFVGVLIVLLPILLARLIALGGWPVTPVVMVLLLIGFCVELLAWSSGFGAVLTNGYARWQARRATRPPTQPVPPPVPPPVTP